MEKIKKVLKTQIMLLVVSIPFLLNSAVYGADTSAKSYLRVPVGIDKLREEQMLEEISFKQLQEYLQSKELSNSAETVEKVINIFREYAKEGKQILLELGGGNTEVASNIAKINKDIGVIVIDRYDVDDPGPDYREWARDFEKENLTAQKLQLENLAVLRADENIFKFLPRNSIDVVLLVAPSFLEERLTSSKITNAAKKIIVKPYYNFAHLYTNSEKPPQEVLYHGYLFRNTNSSVAFNVDIDAMSTFGSGEPLFIWEKYPGQLIDISLVPAEPLHVIMPTWLPLGPKCLRNSI